MPEMTHRPFAICDCRLGTNLAGKMEKMVKPELRMSNRMHGNVSIGSGLLTGILGGLAGSWAMNQFQAVLRDSQPPKRRNQPQGDEPATAQAAQAIAGHLFGHTLSASEKKIAEPAVHYGFGALAGGLYGAATALVPALGAGLGLPYAIGLWFVGDEIAVPALRLSRPARAYPAATHASALASHVVYGLTLDLIRRALSEI